jgi:AcrR family transcriptional regulator
MPRQARAEATRRRIIDSAVDLFTELGYGETGLADVLQRAGVSKGAFYYHFDSKESVAAAIIEEFTLRSMESMRTRVDSSLPPLDQIIVATFVAAEMLETDKTSRIANQLLQSLGQVSATAINVYREWSREFSCILANGIKDAGLRQGHDAVEAAETIWAGVLGCHLLSSAFNDDAYARLASMWRSMMRTLVPAESWGYYDELLNRTTRSLQAVG